MGAFEEAVAGLPVVVCGVVARSARDATRARYLPISHVEQWIPPLFAAAYAGGFLALVLS